MADDQDFEMWDDEFLEKAIQLTEAAVCSSSTNPSQLPPPPQQPLPLYSAPSISYSPPRELTQRVKEDNCRKVFDMGFDCPVSLNGINHGLNSETSFSRSNRLIEEDKCSKQQEIDRLKEALGRVSKELTNLEQECSELRKERDKNEKHLRSVLTINGSKDAEAPCAKKSNLKNKVLIEDHSIVHPGFKGIIPCKAVGVQTDEHATSTGMIIKNDLSVTHPSRKLAGIWDRLSDQKPRTNLVSKLFVACESDLQVLFQGLGSNVPSKRTVTKMDSSKNDFSYLAPNHRTQAVDSTEAAKVSHLYLTLTKISYDTVRLDDFLEALIDLCYLQNMMIVHRSLCVLHVVLKHISSMENKSLSRDNIVIKDPSTMNKSFEAGHLLYENAGETSNPHQPVLTRLINAKKVWNKDGLRDDSSPLISCSKWFSIYQLMLQIITRHNEEIVRLEAVSIMNIVLLRTNAYAEREMYGQVSVFQSISQMLRKEVGPGVQKQAVHLLYLLLNCPNLMAMFCSSFNEEGTSKTSEVLTKNAKTAPAFQGPGAILEGLVDCLACRGNGAPTILVLKLQRNAIILLAFLASSGRYGFEIFLGHNLPKRTNFLYLILQILASEIDVEASECIQASEVFRERTLLIREALILLNRLASNSQYSTPVLRVLTSRRDMACLTVDTASRLSRKGKWVWQSDTMTRQMRESEVLDLARIFKKRVFTFLGDSTSEK